MDLLVRMAEAGLGESEEPGERESIRALSAMIPIIPGMATPRGEGSESSLGGRIFLVGNIGV